MDKYEDLGLEASKFLEDLNMYEASRDGLFRTRRDAGNNSDFEETRRVFASKMTKIHMQKHQEEMAKNNQAIKLNGGHNSGYYTKDRPPINSLRQPGEAAAKPPILSGPVSGSATGSQYVLPLEGHKHHSGVQPELPAGRVYGYGNSYDNKEPHAYQHNTPTPPPSPGNASPVASAIQARHPTSPPATWAPIRENQPGTESSDLSQRLPVNPTVNSLPSPTASSPVTRSPPSSTGSPRGWTGEPLAPGKADPIPALPLSVLTGGADSQQKPSAAHYAPPSPTLRSSPSHNGPSSAPSVQSEPIESTQPPKAQASSTVLSHASVTKASAHQGQGQSQISSCKQVEADVPSSLKASHLPGLAQPAEQGPSSAEVKLEALTQRLEKEMDAQPKADYFGKTLSTSTRNKEASVT